MAQIDTHVTACKHPPLDQLMSYALGKLFDSTLIESVETHLENCLECRRAVEDAPADDLMELVRDSSMVQITGEEISRDADAEPGSLRHDRKPLRLITGYEILEEIGRGGMGVVFRARQLGLNRIVALKRLKSGMLAGREELQRFNKEAAALASLQHPNIVQVFDAGEQDGEPFLAMEYIDGQPLSSLLSQTTLDPEVTAELVRSLAEAMDVAHESGVIHRDLKPCNVLIPKTEATTDPTKNHEFQALGVQEQKQLLARIKIVDFGLAKLIQPTDHQTHSDVWLGTPGYMAPEQADESAPTSTGVSDVYSLGAICYECLVGRPPHCGSTHFETLRQLREDDPIPPRRFEPNLSVDLQTICLKCLEKDGNRRYATPRELADDLQRFLAGQPIQARPIGLGESATRWVRRRPTVAALLAILILASIGSVVGVIYHVTQLQLQIDQTKAMAEIATLEQQRADNNYEQARETVARIYKLVDESWNSKEVEVRQLSEQLLERSIAFFHGVVENGDDASATLLDLATSHEWYAILLLRNGNLTKAREQYRLAADLFQKLRTRHPDDGSYKLREAVVAVNHGNAWREEPHNLEIAVAHARAGLAAIEQIAAAKPTDPVALDSLAWAHRSLAINYFATEEYDKAEQSLRSAIKVREKLIAQDPQENRYEFDIGWDHRSLARSLETKVPQEAEVEYQQAERHYKNIIKNDVYRILVKRELAATYLQWCMFVKANDDATRTNELYQSGVRLVDELLEHDPSDSLAQQLRSDFQQIKSREP